MQVVASGSLDPLELDSGVVGVAMIVLISWPWGFCAMQVALATCRRRVGALDDAIPPIGGAESASGADGMPKP